MTENPDLIPVREKKPAASGCGCGTHDGGPLVLDARQIPHRLRHPAVIGAVSCLGVGEKFELLASHVPTPLLKQIDRLPFTYQHTLLEAEEGFARVEILRTA